MHWRAVPGILHIAVHTDESPSDEDWDAYLRDVVEHSKTIKGVLVYTVRVGPSAPQRARASELFKSLNVDLHSVIMTGSRVTQGIVTALSWAIGQKIKAFSTSDFEGAVKYLGLDADEQIKVRVVLRQLARAAELEVDAFAEESGRFRQKFK